MVYRFALAALLLAPSHAGAQSAIYKCEQDGKVSYSSAPCSGGMALPAVASGPAASANKEGKLPPSEARLKAMADQLTRERHQREAQEERQQQRAAVRHRQCDKLRLRKKWSDEDAAKLPASASAAARGKAQRQARHQAERLALDCPA